MRNEFVVTATRSMRSYAAKVLEYLKKYTSIASNKSIDGINALEVKTFADGEMEVLVNISLRGKDVFIFTSCARNDAGISVNDARIELYHAIDALKRSRCEKIVVFEPYVSCARSDRPMDRSSVGLWVHFKSIVELGAGHIVTYQLHSDKSKAMLDPTLCLLDDLPALTLVKKYICDNHVKTVEKLASFTLIPASFLAQLVNIKTSFPRSDILTRTSISPSAKVFTSSAFIPSILLLDAMLVYFFKYSKTFTA
ncbi:hypothetical protein AGMMS50212_10030 [Spirochaetia bacterium]|nr:hypothetical protein AGMMS50212_10030 [Spirochaetia bacterium]